MQHASALERGLIDVGITQGLTISYLQRRYPSLQILYDMRTPETARAMLGFEQLPQTILIASDRWLQANPALVRSLASAVLCGLQWIHSHTAQEIRDILPAHYRSPDADVDLDAIGWAQRKFSKDGRMPAEAHQVAVEILKATGDPNLPFREAYTNEFLP